jgi:hypothetical protein
VSTTLKIEQASGTSVHAVVVVSFLSGYLDSGLQGPSVPHPTPLHRRLGSLLANRRTCPNFPRFPDGVL